MFLSVKQQKDFLYELLAHIQRINDQNISEEGVLQKKNRLSP